MSTGTAPRRASTRSVPIALSEVVAYVDTSALAKLLKVEDESGAVETALSDWEGSIVSSVILEPELRRVAVRYGIAQHACDALLEAVTLIDLDDAVRRRTGVVAPADLRALDAIHLATALALGARLGVLFAYDERLVDAALLQGVRTSTPAPG